MIVVTGGRGYIGSNLMQILPGDAAIYDLKDGLDVRDEEQLSTFIRERRPTSIIHLAAISGIAACESDHEMARTTNIEGTRNVCRAAEEVAANVVFASSAAARRVENFYGYTKHCAETIVLSHGGTACRISNVYGGENYLEMKDTVVARLLRDTFIDRGCDAELRDFIHVDEVCRCLLEAAVKPPGRYSISTGVNTSIWALRLMAKRPDFPGCLRAQGRLLMERGG